MGKIEYPWGWMQWHYTRLDGANTEHLPIPQSDPAQVSLGFSTATMFIKAAAVSPAHQHGNCAELIVVNRGYVDLILEGVSQRLESGQSALIPCGAAHTLAAPVEDAHLTLIFSSEARSYKSL